MGYTGRAVKIPIFDLVTSTADKAAADKAAADKAAADKAAADKAAADKAAAKVTVGSKSTITCTKGKLTKKVTASNPKCPAGFKRR
jgi:membrane protein involved in colicin uptake